MEICVDETKLKELMKQAFVEVLEDRKEVIYQVLLDIIEEIALVNAIKEGEASELVDEREVLCWFPSSGLGTSETQHSKTHRS